METGHPAGLGSITQCPACSGDLEAVFDGEDTNFLCRACGRCWHVESGYVGRVDPATCPGCPMHDACVARWSAEVAVRAASME